MLLSRSELILIVLNSWDSYFIFISFRPYRQHSEELHGSQNILPKSEKVYAFLVACFSHVYLIACICVGHMHVSGTHGGQNTAWNSLEMELQRIVICCVGAENRT